MNDFAEITPIGDVVETNVPIIQQREDIDVQIATAKRYPRSIKQFLDDARSMACLDEETAGSCFYVLPRAGKKIEGPSIRLAEIVANCWGNLRFGSRIVGESEDRRFVIAEGMAYDMQRNVAASVTVRRRITTAQGKRYSEDMIQTTGMAAGSIALRNALFKVIPMTHVNQLYADCKRLAVGDATSLKDRVHRMVDAFSKFGITKDLILHRLEKKGLEDIDLSDMEMLIGIHTSLKEGIVDPDTAFPDPEAKPKEQPKSLKDKVKAKAQGKEEEPKQDLLTNTEKNK